MRTTKSLLVYTLVIAFLFALTKLHVGIGVFFISIMAIAALSSATWRGCRGLTTKVRFAVVTVFALLLFYVPASGPLYFSVRVVHAYEKPTGPTADFQTFVVHECFGEPIGALMTCFPAIQHPLTVYLRSWDASGFAVHQYLHPPPKDVAAPTFYYVLNR